jgi:glycosyltransferase involved in cell wall biosynthesis
VFRADQNYLSEAVRIHTNSRVTSARLLQFNGLNSEVLYPPLLNHAAYRCEEYGDFVFCPSRINQSKRQHLLIQAMKYVRTDVRLVLAGQIETAADRALIEQLLGDPQIAARVVLLDRYISEQEKLDLFSRARACAYIPYDEDSYGYVTLEAFLSRKPVITGTDSGGTDLLVKDRLTGRIVAPDPRRIAEAMDELAADQQLAARWGTAGFELAQSLEIHWDRVIQVLTK